MLVDEGVTVYWHDDDGRLLGDFVWCIGTLHCVYWSVRSDIIAIMHIIVNQFQLIILFLFRDGLHLSLDGNRRC